MFTPPRRGQRRLSGLCPSVYFNPVGGALLAPANHTLTGALRALDLARAAWLPELPSS